MPDTKVGLTLSGGGIRAVVFHFGVLRYLAETKLWSSISHISTVSGGSLAIGLLLARAGFVRPTRERLLRVIDEASDLISTKDLQRTFILNHLRRPYLTSQGRANLLADALTRTWGIDARLSDLPSTPDWWINTT